MIYINQKIRKILFNAVYSVEKENGSVWFDEFPFEKYREALGNVGAILVQEDGTPFEGIFCGSTGSATIMFAYNGEIVENSRFIFNWYGKEVTGARARYEINAYIS